MTDCPDCHGALFTWRYGRQRSGNSVREPVPCRCTGGEWTLPGTEHITADPERCGGRPCLRGTRFDVRAVIDYLRRYSPEEMVTWNRHVPAEAFREVRRLVEAGTYPEEFWEQSWLPEGARGVGTRE